MYTINFKATFVPAYVLPIPAKISHSHAQSKRSLMSNYKLVKIQKVSGNKHHQVIKPTLPGLWPGASWPSRLQKPNGPQPAPHNCPFGGGGSSQTAAAAQPTISALEPWQWHSTPVARTGQSPSGHGPAAAVHLLHLESQSK